MKTDKLSRIIKKDLHEAFPDRGFSVMTAKGAYVDGIDVYYNGERDMEFSAKIHTLLKKYIRGYFDGLTDSYVRDNVRDDIPQCDRISICARTTSALYR